MSLEVSCHRGQQHQQWEKDCEGQLDAAGNGKRIVGGGSGVHGGQRGEGVEVEASMVRGQSPSAEGCSLGLAEENAAG